ncbi:DUF6510 family protein [Planctomonas sp. JC2975]|uniref:DUF6510 family protein n=1 Tax=Planctomonas sp. JC2975 TaxID=2729626 RepID=UPI001F0D9899|nr:DUF6510 family protein [Planctomonas sp. JC2975]
MQKLDGNVLAGPLASVFDGDATSATGRCTSCGDTAAVAQAVVYAATGRYVARCRRCDQVLLTIAEDGDSVLLAITGITGFAMVP